VGRVTVVIDRRRGAAQVRYARNPIARAPCDAAQVIAACRRAVARLGRESLDPDRFGPALAAAYTSHLAGRPVGERVELPLLAAAVGRAAGRRRYSRAQLAWDLARLRSERGLSLPEGRIGLEAATGRRRFWIEDETGTGQYYGVLRLLPSP
jgi:hypothetical protein